MSLLFKLIMKIKNIVIFSILSILLGLIMLSFVVGFFALPFIVYSPQIKNIFLGIWCFCAIEFFIEMILVAKSELKKNKKEIEEYKKDKIVYWFLRLSAGLSCIFTFLLAFLKMNYQFPISVYDIIFAFVCFLVIVALISNLLSMYKNKYKQMMQDGALLFLCLFCLLCISAGIMAYNEESSTAKILIGIGATVLLVIGIRYVFKFLLSIEKINTVSSSIILFMTIGILGGILLRYVITDCKLQEILTSIFAAVIGGAITLAGVAWTIKKGDNDRKAENRRKAKPFIGIIDDYTKDSTEAYKNGIQFCKKTYETCIDAKIICYLENSDKCLFYLDKVQVEGVDYYPDSKKLISKNEKFAIFIMESKNYPGERKEITLFLTDENYEERIFDICLGRESCYEQIIERE